jgi:hypothetical protein
LGIIVNNILPVKSEKWIFKKNSFENTLLQSGTAGLR